MVNCHILNTHQPLELHLHRTHVDGSCFLEFSQISHLTTFPHRRRTQGRKKPVAVAFKLTCDLLRWVAAMTGFEAQETKVMSQVHTEQKKLSVIA